MLIKEAPSTTLSQLRHDVAGVRDKSVDLPLRDITVDLVDEEVIHLGEIDLPVTKSGLDSLSDWVEVPPKTMAKFDADIQQYLLTTLIQRTAGTVNVFYNDRLGITEMYKSGIGIIFPEQLVSIAQKVIDPEALVASAWSNAREFRLDVIVPENFEKGIGGDLKQGDITKGGIRIGHDRKRNLAPWVSEFLYRVICTNGLEIFDEGLKVDARGNTVPEVLAEFEVMADRAFRRVERSIPSFYDLRSQLIDNPERELLRIAQEEGIADRMALELADTAAAAWAGEDVSMFDIVNHITNLANDPDVKDGPGRKLQQTGGLLVSQHVQRCTHCRSKLN